MAGGGRGRGRGRGGKQTSKRSHSDDSQGSDSEHSEHMSDVEIASTKDKGKALMPSMSHKGAASPPQHSTGGLGILETPQRERQSKRSADTEHIDPKRQEAFASRTCIGERYVNFEELNREVPDFAQLMQRAPIETVGHIHGRMGFCVALIREFYMRGQIIEENSDTGHYLFETNVRGVRVVVSLETIGRILGLNMDISGVHYTFGTIQYSTHWNTIVHALCKQGTITNRLYVESKDLRPEYHILFLILCYNILPTLGTKRIRWDRLVVLYLLGHPEQADGMNINIPSLIWHRMAQLVQGTTHRELLPYPLLITRILDNQGVDIRCDKYDYSLGPIDGVTLAKSISTLRTFQQVKAYTEATSRPPARRQEHQSSSGPREIVTLESLDRDVQSLKKRVKEGFKKLEEKLEEGLKKIFDFLGCRRDDTIQVQADLDPHIQLIQSLH